MTTLQFTVTDDDTAVALGSGDVPVLATPRLLAWVEAATVAAATVELDPSSTSVGAEVWLRHRRPSPVGSVVEVTVTSVGEQDRGLAFDVVAAHPAEAGGPAVEVATARIVRAVVDRQAFLDRLAPRGAEE